MISTLARSLMAAAFAAAVFVSATPSRAGDAPGAAAPTGVWLDEQGRGAIEIAPCGEGLCGRLVWVKDKKEARSACGLQIIGDVKRIDAATWNGGWIYSPELKSRFDVELKPADDGTLVVTGFAGSRDLSETMIWRRAPADLGRCGGSTERAGYVAAKVEPKQGVAVAVTTGAVAVGVSAAVIKKRVADKSAARASRSAKANVASRSSERSVHRHTATCHVPFASFRCSSSWAMASW